MSALLTGALISGGIGLAKSIFGGVQAVKGNKQMKNLLANRPTYNIPEAYMKALGLAQQRAAGEMPGMEQYKQMYGQATARAMSGAERGAISSNVYQGAVESAQDKELQALQQLAIMGTQYKTQASQQLEAAQNRMGGLQDQAFEYNVNQPYQMKLNMANEQKQAGMQNLWSGISDIGSTVMNFAGTKYMNDVMQGLQGGGSSKVFNNPNQQFSAPLNNARSIGSPGSIVNSASGMMGQPQFPSNYDWMWDNLRKQGYNNG